MCKLLLPRKLVKFSVLTTVMFKLKYQFILGFYAHSLQHMFTAYYFMGLLKDE